jgi:hypothetical protein
VPALVEAGGKFHNDMLKASIGFFFSPNRRRQLAAGTTEIYLHPATAGDTEGAAAGYRYVEELQALTDRALRAAVEATGARFCGFGDLVPVPPPIVS